MKEYDIVIVGNGCSGSVCAFFSKYYGKEKNVLLLEKLNEEKYEKYHKMCGCVVSKKLLDEIKPISLKTIGKIKKQIEVFPNNIEIETKVNGVIIDRVSSLNKIKEDFLKLGGDFLNCSLIDFVKTSDEIKIKLSNSNFIKTKYLVDCSGASSPIRKKLGIKANNIVLFQYLVEKNPLKDTIIFEYDEKYRGNYKWQFPYRNFTKIGSPFNFKVKNAIEKHVRTISFGGLKKYVYGNILLCGESGNQTNAITKGGIRIAMVSGKLSALAVVKENPSLYENEFKKTNFDNEVFLKAFSKFKKMKNEDLAKIGEIYKAFLLSQKIGW